MAALVGTVSPFDCELQSWDEYIEVLDYFFQANEITDAGKRKAVLLSGVGASTYSLLRSLLCPMTPAEKTYQELVVVLKAHYNPKPSEIVQRYKFNSRTRHTGEKVADYVAELKKLAQYCEYGPTLPQMLRDRLVCGVNDDRMQRRLLSEVDLTFEKALTMCLAMESADRNIKDLQGFSGDEESQSQRSHQGQSVVHNVGAVDKRGWKTDYECFRCKGNHAPHECKFINELCHHCQKRGHIKRACKSKHVMQSHKTPFQGLRGERKGKEKAGRSHLVKEEDVSETEDAGDINTIYSVSHKMPKVAPILQKLKVNGMNIEFEVDTGCGITIISKKQYSKLWKNTDIPEWEPCNLTLKTYTGEKMLVLGQVIGTVQSQMDNKKLTMVVVEGAGPNLLGRNWLKDLRVLPQLVNTVTASPTLHLADLLDRYAEVFKDELGQLKGTTAKIHVNSEAQPRFYKPRRIPFAVKPLVEAELQRLVDEKIIEPVQFSEWAAPIVPVRKPDGSIRICGDYKLTVNRASSVEQYPIPKVEDLFAQLAGGNKFSKLDMSHAYQQIVLDESAKKYVTVNTHKGLYTYGRLPFGVASSPAIFQRTMEGILQNMPHVTVYLDDILVTGVSEDDHLRNLEEVLSRLKQSGLRLKRSKCKFLGTEVVFLGHKISAAGVQPVAEKVQAIQEAPTPRSVSELKAYLGLLNYYHKFLPSLSTLLAPLHALLRKETKWTWSCEQKEAFEKSKNLLQSDALLVHYDVNKPIILACDASPYGVGAVLSHRMGDGSERPIGFVSRTLNAAEKNYSQIEKEGLAVIFGVKKFHTYLYGRQFTIVTDHKPLISLFNELKEVPQMASPRIQRWAVTLCGYEYSIVYKAGKDHQNADGLSRLPVAETGVETPAEEERVLLLEENGVPLVKADQVRKWTDKDTVLARVREFVLRGWPKRVEKSVFGAYVKRKEELSVEAGCVLWGARVVIPPPGRTDLLKHLHTTHPGIIRMKGLARSYMWWPKMDADIEAMVKTCTMCQENRNSPQCAPLHPWEVPNLPWRRLHIDYAGPWMGKMFLILVDAYSKWIEAYPLSKSTSAVTIQCLRQSFSQHGIPEMVVSDNGTSFTSMEFQEFMARNGIKHVTTAPYHAASNGLAERAVQTFKGLIKKSSGDSIEVKMARALFSYRITPQSTTGKSPAELLCGRKLRSTLDLIHPDFKGQVQEKQVKQKLYHDQHAKERHLREGDKVYTRNFGVGPSWIPGTVQKQTGPVSCTVALGNGQIVRRHIDQVRNRHVAYPEDLQSLAEPLTQDMEILAPLSGVVLAEAGEEGQMEGELVTEKSSETAHVEGEQELRRSTRTKKAPTYLQDYT
uniref:Gypsy retrotransposon integrase-like protein 1 n=2 Tax=Leptobrachium leishanense TaxID=445787 RepID=A0A8C5QT05_9ANUR